MLHRISAFVLDVLPVPSDCSLSSPGIVNCSLLLKGLSTVSKLDVDPISLQRKHEGGKCADYHTTSSRCPCPSLRGWMHHALHYADSASDSTHVQSNTVWPCLSLALRCQWPSHNQRWKLEVWESRCRRTITSRHTRFWCRNA